MRYTLTEAATLFAELDGRPPEDVLGLARRLKNFEARGRIESLPERGPRDAALLDERELPRARVLSAACDMALDDVGLRAVEAACDGKFDWSLTGAPPERFKQDGAFHLKVTSSLEAAVDGVEHDEPWVLRLVFVIDGMGRPEIKAAIEPDEGEDAVVARVRENRLADEGRKYFGVTRMPLKPLLRPLLDAIAANNAA